MALYGRDSELELLDGLTSGIRERGGALLVRGGPGIGKSTLLAESSRRAQEAGLRVLTTNGVESEARLPFAGLHQLLRPILGGAGKLPRRQRDALLGAFGMSEVDAPSPFLVALGALELLADEAESTPLMLVVDEGQWIDRSTAGVLIFVARRLESEPIVLLIAARDGAENAFEGEGLPDLSIGPLDDAAALELLGAQAADLDRTAQTMLMREAEGNPLALVELPRSLREAQPSSAWFSRDFALTERLERAFAGRSAEFPSVTQTALLVAAVNDGTRLTEALEAAARIVDSEIQDDVLAPAVAARLLELEDEEVRFRHPLVRSAIRAQATSAERRAAHSELAEVLAGNPDRAVWHRAASIEGYDGDVAAALEEAARRALRRGADAVAAAGFERAAALTQDTDARAALLIVAADIEVHLGRPDLGLRLLRSAQAPIGLSEDRQMQLAFATEILDEAAWSGATKVPALVRVAEQQRDAGKTELAAYTLQNAAMRYWYGNPDQAERDQVVAAGESLGMAPDDPALLFVLALADPVGQGGVVLERLSKIAVPADPHAAQMVGVAAQAVWAHDLSILFLTPAAAGLRAMGALGTLAQTLVMQAWGGVHVANPPLALSAAEEAETLARETGQPRWVAAATLARASITAMRGESSGAEILATEAERVFLPAGASPMLALVQFVRARAALADGRNADAYDHASRIFDESDHAYHLFFCGWAVADLAEAAAAVGAHEEARALIAPVEAIEAKMHGPLLRAELGVAGALLADDSQAPDVFAEALAAIEAPWPYHRGRLLLAHGSWLRRRRRVAESRRPLRAARDLFDTLGFEPAAERARQELRASGETSRRRVPEAWDQLSPQELQIARLAADGLTNREIGQQLYLSHRTVASHLYRVFPKLGVTSRSQLAAMFAHDQDSSPAVV
jgi:DNA-binding CsgD family transcriptional regulator